MSSAGSSRRRRTGTRWTTFTQLPVAFCAGRIENWAPVDELPARPRENEWARRHGLDGKPVLLYSGTLGLKHDPGLLHRLAEALPEVAVVVASEGLGADWLPSDR